jgi:hypothetical protein
MGMIRFFTGRRVGTSMASIPAFSMIVAKKDRMPESQSWLSMFMVIACVIFLSG